MGKVYVFLADGFEEIEGLTVVDILRRGEIDTCMVSITGKKEIAGSHGIRVEADALFEETDFSDALMLVLPGGMPGTLHLGEHKGLTSLLQETAAAGGRIAAICAAPTVLGDLGLLEGKRATCYPGKEDRLRGAECLTDETVVSGNITTSRGLGTALPFALKLLELLRGEDVSSRIAASVVYCSLSPLSPK